MAGSSIGRTTDFESVGWRFEPSPASQHRGRCSMQQTRRVTQSITAIVLAAGVGKRMQSDLPKPLHRLANRALIDWVISALSDKRITTGVVVVGHGGTQLTHHLEYLSGTAVEWHFVTQAEQLGTGHATTVALEALTREGSEMVLIVPGDTPLLRATSITKFINQHLATGAALSVMSAVVENPTGYGRIIRDEDDNVASIVEERDATDSERAIHEINTGIMIGSLPALESALHRVGRGNAQGEYYLTDVVGILVASGALVRADCLIDFTEAQGVNDPEQLAYCESVLAERAEQ